MSKSAAVFFTGMEPVDAAQLTALFEDVNRRSGKHWTLAPNLDAASVLVIDVDTLYGHMTWLRSQNSSQTIVALTTGTNADADYVLHRPVTTDSMRRLLHDLAKSGNGAPALSASAHAEPAPAARTEPPPPRPAAVIAPSDQTSATSSAVTQPPRPAAVTAPSHQTSAASSALTQPPPAAAPTPPTPAPATPSVSATPTTPTTPTTHKLIDALLSTDIDAGPQRLDLPGLAPLVLDMTQKVFLCGNGIKGFLPHTQTNLNGQTWQPLSAAEFATMRKTVGGTQPIGRLVWLAALGASDGEIAGAAPDARYRLTKWPQIEREFPKHFRIATTMMKGFNSAEAIAQQSGCSLAEVNDFIAASLVSGHAEIEPTAPSPDVAAVAPKSLLGRLRGGR